MPRPVFSACGWLHALVAACFLHVLSTPANASITVFAGEPFGNFGTMMPFGHVSIYLDRVCADGPLKLRMCHPGEPAGVAIARYDRIGGNDWIATPILQFLYAVDRPEDVLPYATPGAVWDLRQAYRRRYLAGLVPDGEEKRKATEEWWESAGVAYNRRLWGYRLDTTPEQDAQIVALMNLRGNHHRYHLIGSNCANFGADLVNLFFPQAVSHPDRISDLGYMTPKQVMRSVVRYAAIHPGLNLEILEVPQVPGSLRRSRPVRGAAEGLLKTKRYLFTLLVIQPEAPLALSLMYLHDGRWQAGKGAEPVTPAAFAQTRPDPQQATTDASAPSPNQSPTQTN